MDGKGGEGEVDIEEKGLDMTRGEDMRRSKVDVGRSVRLVGVVNALR